ncbi:peroxiredoxin-like family protein [Asaia spathodeae]|uniref:thioredoxin-dependent peroxiredoxin n=1 Tax=Asaia spathodeae TaxID=657016 RepID=A0ABX2P940_9PROT|nr:peroxiredoxin-like family protein [Asaia spathodeae]GBR20906.1 alkyl hydroperoxide reductase [Asaia spathodeae NBRC 105894]
MGDFPAALDATDRKTPSLSERFEALEREREQSWPAEALAINRNQRALLVREHDLSSRPGVGDRFPDALLTGLDGTQLTYPQADGKPSVLIFFRFAGCPACNIALPYYRDHLFPELRRLDVELIAISPQPPQLLRAISEAHQLPFAVVTDEGLELSRKLGITYEYDEPSRQAAIEKGIDPRSLNGMDRWELPKPAIYVLDRKKHIIFRDVSPDWMQRTDFGPIVEASKKITDVEDLWKG